MRARQASRHRLRARRLNLLSRDYLTHRALWPALEAAVAEARATLPQRAGGAARVLDLGCGERPYADLFDGLEVLGVDLDREGASPDLIASALALPLPAACVQMVFSAQVIEHVADPAQMLAECARVLVPGGALVLSGPFWWPLHEEPHDYFRYTRHGLAALLAHKQAFDRVRIEPDCGALTQAVVAVIELLPRWAAPVRWTLNLLTPALQRLSDDRRSTLNYIVTATRSAAPLA